YMQAFRVALQERNFRILDALIELTQQMVEGELLQIEKLGKLISLDDHFDLIYRKTACLFSVCMQMGAILGGASAEQEENLEQYGSIDAAHQRAEQFALLARNAICSFPDSEIKRSLLWAPDFVVGREK